MKAWLIRYLLKEERPRIFALAQKDVLETMADDLEKRADVLAIKKLKELLWLSAIPEVVETKAGRVFINGEPADSQRVSNLKAEADFFAASDLWKVLNDTMNDDAQRTMFVLGEDAPKQLATGRTILYTLSVQKSAIDRLQKVIHS